MQSWCPAALASAAPRAKSKPPNSPAPRNVPYLGICLGMQMAVIEAARNRGRGLAEAGSEEFDHEAGGKNALRPGRLSSQRMGRRATARSSASQTDDKGGTMRLGAYNATLKEAAKSPNLWHHIEERHRHRYEVDTKYREPLEAKGMAFPACPPMALPEIVERTEHPWYIGVQFHPELKSKPFDPHPLFADFVRAARDNSRLV